MKLKDWGALLAMIALPFILTNTGCGFHSNPESPKPVDPNAYVCACSCGPGLRHRELRILAGADDAEQRLDNSILLDSPDLDFQTGRFVGLRFPGLLIPKGAHIISAKVQFTTAPGSTAGALTQRIYAEAADDAAPFLTTSNAIGLLPSTAATVQWDLVVSWNLVGEAGPNQATPDLDVVVQEIVNRPGWVQGNALALLFRGNAGGAIRKGFTVEGKAAAAALLTVDYEEPSPTLVGPQELPICLPPAALPKPTEDAIAADCANRVQPTLSGLAAACGYPSDCHCGMQPGTATFSESLKWSDKCEATCTEDPVDVAHDCANFDPVHGIATATNAPGGTPVCAALSPLSAEVFGRRTTCSVEGTAHVEVDDDSKNPHAQGIVQFVGDPCPGGSCAVAMQYRLDIGDVTFGNFFHSETFHDLAGLGETSPGGEAVLNAGGDGSFARDAAGVAAQGRRGSQLNGLAATNDDPVDINVAWGATGPTCSVKGRLIGSVDPELKRCENAGPSAGDVCDDDHPCTDDPDCTDGVCDCEPVSQSDLSMSLDVAGDILNQPPKANAGADQEVECTSSAVNNVVLDGSASADLDGNIALFSWLRGTRGGPIVGFDEKSKVEQKLGTQNYVLRVIDALGQTDEDTTQVRVLDTTAPVLTCATTLAMLDQSDHNLLDVGLSGSAVDQCEGELPVTVKVFGDEDDEEDAGGRFSPDATGLAPGSLRLRSERKGNGDGRVYLVVVQATDSSGNLGSDCCTVTVPHDNSVSSGISAAAQANAARAFCNAHNGTPPAGFFVVGDGPVVGPKQ